MKRFISFLVPVAAFVFCVAQAQAGLIGTVTHDYGKGGHSASTLKGGSCDTLNTASITVRNTSGCQRFYDAFDFSHLNYSSIESFSLSVTFSNTANGSLLNLTNYELWRVRPASSAVKGSGINNASVNIDRSTGMTTATYTFYPWLDVFSDIVNNQTFYLWFNHSGRGTQNFTLFSASLDVYGTPRATATVPAPAMFGLMSIGFLSLLLIRRRRHSA